MRRLMQTSVMITAISIGGLTAMLCLPYLAWKTAHRQLFLLRAYLLFPVVILLLQVAVAWTPLIPGRHFLSKNRKPVEWLVFSLTALILAFLQARILDPLVESIYPGILPQGWRQILLSLPWTALFQPLLLVAGIYAFCVRLTGSEKVAAAMIIFTHACLVVRHWPVLPPGWFLVCLAAGIIFALFQTEAYRRQGYPALIWIGIIMGLRFGAG